MRGYTPCNHIQLEICLNLAKMKKDKFSLIYGTYLGQDFTHMWDTKTNKQNKMNKPKKKTRKKRKTHIERLPEVKEQRRWQNS